MDSRSVLMLLCLLTTSSCQPWRAWWMPDRRQPPPVVSLEHLQKIHGGEDVRAPQKPGLEAGERPPWWASSEGARNQLSLFRSSVPGHRFPRHLLASPPVRGCHLGTCQIQNLANLLYRYGGNNQKDESSKNNKGATGPMGYGRRKRRAVSVPT
ncbi:pro-adrenomedullin-like [Eublepharis macularius]|uniref:Pro-adrenomedullin-like n=1 Tax=Eublepharis macularius TaxID=481883 RepID=A0AA97LCR5_EUBMA|nr:pro-adrenomedullin-like [Eublepharis macularius]